MPVLRDPQHERFCRELVEEVFKIPPASRPILEAFKRAGFAPHAGNATRLSRRPEVKERFNELIEEYREYLDIRPIKALIRVERVADAKLPEYFEPDGVTLKNITTLSPRLKEALKSIKWTARGTDADGNPIMVPEIDLHDKNQANFTLIKHFGGMPESAGNTTHVNVFNALSLDDQAALADIIEAFTGGARAAGAEVAGERGAS